MDHVTLHTGTEMPAMGLGTWQLTGDTAARVVRDALDLGYRMIDTSGDYGNQPAIREVLRSGGVDRSQVFLVTKVEEDEDVLRATRERLDELGIEAADLVLLHRPPRWGAGEDLWRGLVAARAAGLARDIGVSNYSPAQIERLVEATGETPAVNQIEWSPFGHSRDVLDWSRAHGVVIQGYSPLTRGERLDAPVLAGIGVRHGRTPAQVMLRWNLQHGTVPLPKASTGEHLRENLEVFDFVLSREEMGWLDRLNERYSALAGNPAYA